MNERRIKTLEKVKKQKQIDHVREQSRKRRNKNLSLLESIYNVMYPNGYPQEFLNVDYV